MTKFSFVLFKRRITNHVKHMGPPGMPSGNPTQADIARHNNGAARLSLGGDLSFLLSILAAGNGRSVSETTGASHLEPC